MVTELLDEYKWSVLGHLRYFPDLGLCNAWLFPKTKEHLCGHGFESDEDITFVTKESIRWLDKDFYVTAFDSWLRRVQKIIDNDSCYVD
ncbi:histone-lysine N-methyltransferase SETMAR [Plakobranchus ocellatus]|uniref:Histone-lysine N-methyltransferase SETMAR n=1 Tax=Plakobranchus ocellatus TaxID=259542 RepID=A0AAV3YVZ1_9GAST|nr:histone-lysine N-methyltransferase SETMAR [Plakobranchus ocellatus]